MSDRITILRGNKKDFVLSLKQNGVAYTGLSGVEKVTVAIGPSGSKTTNAILYNNIDHPTKVEIDIPEVGDVFVHLSSLDTDLELTEYDVAVQCKLDQTNNEEWEKESAILVKQDRIV